MNSRIALLSIFFAAPIFCMDNTVTSSTSTSNAAQVVANSGICSTVGDFVKSCVTTPVNFVLASADKVADVAYLNALIAKITETSFLKDTFINNNREWISRAIVVAGTYALINELHNRYVAQQAADNDDADFDFTYEANEDEVENN